MRKIELDNLLLGQNIDNLLKSLVASVARTCEVAFGLLLMGVVEGLGELPAKENEVLIFGWFKRYFSHCFEPFTVFLECEVTKKWLKVAEIEKILRYLQREIGLATFKNGALAHNFAK